MAPGSSDVFNRLVFWILLLFLSSMFNLRCFFAPCCWWSQVSGCSWCDFKYSFAYIFGVLILVVVVVDVDFGQFPYLLGPTHPLKQLADFQSLQWQCVVTSVSYDVHVTKLFKIFQVLFSPIFCSFKTCISTETRSAKAELCLSRLAVCIIFMQLQ